MEHGIQTVYDSAIWCTKGLSTNIGYYYHPDVEKRVLSAMTIRYLYSNIKCTVFKILYNLSLPSETIEDIEKSFPDILIRLHRLWVITAVFPSDAFLNPLQV